jgi:hypothetical protein
MKKIIIASLCLVLVCQSVRAGAFSQNGFSARSSALGNSYTALSNDVEGIFFNPAGLAGCSGIQVQTSFAKLFPDVEDDNLSLMSGGVLYPLAGLGTIGIGGTFFNSVNWKESELAGAYGMNVLSVGSSTLSVGGTFRLLHWSAAAAPGESALSYTGFTVNAGVQYTLKNLFVDALDVSANSLRLGLHVENLTQPSVSSSGSSDAKLPMNVEAGVAYISGAYDYMITAGVARAEGVLRYKAGAEFLVAGGDFFGSKARVVVRFGGDRDARADSQGEYTGGFGLVWNALGIDYVYLYPVEMTDLGGTQRITLLYNF